eukprot:692527_1
MKMKYDKTTLNHLQNLKLNASVPLPVLQMIAEFAAPNPFHLKSDNHLYHLRLGNEYLLNHNILLNPHGFEILLGFKLQNRWRSARRFSSLSGISPFVSKNKKPSPRRRGSLSDISDELDDKIKCFIGKGFGGQIYEVMISAIESHVSKQKKRKIKLKDVNCIIC